MHGACVGHAAGFAPTAAPPLAPTLACQERDHARALAALDADLASRARQLLAATRDNTAALAAVSDVARSQAAMEAAVQGTRAGLFEDQLAARRAALAERHALVATVNERAAALRAVRARIDTLRRKDGALYAAAG